MLKVISARISSEDVNELKAELDVSTNQDLIEQLVARELIRIYRRRHAEKIRKSIIKQNEKLKTKRRVKK